MNEFQYIFIARAMKAKRVKCAYDDKGGEGVVDFGCAVCVQRDFYGWEKLHMSFELHCECV